MKRLFFVTVLAQLCLSPLFTNMALAQEGLDDPTRAVVLNMSARAYRPSFWNINSLQSTVYAIDLSHESTLFTVGKSYNSKSFVSYHTLPIPIKRYPILVLTYQATNLLSQPRHALWLDDGTGPNSGGAYAMQSNQFIADGKTHEYHIDLRQLSWRKKQSPLNFITGMCFYIHLGKEAPGEFKILDMRFVTDDDAPSIKPYADDAPMTVKVVDSQGNPIANATVTADDEWSNFARSTKTNSQGQATLTPMTNQANKHILTASADGFAQVRLKQLPPAGPITIILPKGVSLSGIVHNEQGQPIAGAMVNGYATCQTRNRSQYIDCSFAVLTDEQGKWQSPIVAVYPNLTTAPPPVINKLPRTMLQRLLSIPSQTTVVSNAPNTVPQQISLKLGHIDYLSDSTGQS
ncbi:MAG: carboxypeptidase regulatory-like domain-containing protein, partial [Phycisphaeraceae bacterium]|nr:carboxypeptidase regulatory-like domain-containing protein [Phycisphaeraceae bacterium]